MNAVQKIEYICNSSHFNNNIFGLFIDMNINNIHIALLGPVSAGKSTFFNAIFTQTCSEMNRRKTTMLPQIYEIETRDDIKTDTSAEIFKRNKESNDNILKKREDGTFNILNDFKEVVHHVKPLNDFISENVTKKTSYSILDMPGLNCGGDDMYYDYIKKISYKIDIYVLLLDINSGLNTTDEIKILDFIVTEIKKNGHGYLHILINKCDNFELDDNGNPEFADDELNELYTRMLTTINHKCNDIKKNVSYSPMCSNKLYVYRGIMNNIESIEGRHLDNIIVEQCGKAGLKNLTKGVKDKSDESTLKKKRKFISGLINKDKKIGKGWMNETGYTVFKSQLDNILKKCDSIICHHVKHLLKNALSVVKEFTQHSADFYDDLIYNISIADKEFKKISKVAILHDIIEIMEHISTELFKACNKSINSFGSSYDKINNVRHMLMRMEQYTKILSSYVSLDCNKESVALLINKKNELLTQKFVDEFDPVIFEEIVDIINIDIFTDSVKKLLTSNFNDFEMVYTTLKKCKKTEFYAPLLILYKSMISSYFVQDENMSDRLAICEKHIRIITNMVDNLKCKEYFDIVKKIISSFLLKEESDHCKFVHWVASNSFKLNVQNLDEDLSLMYFKLHIKSTKVISSSSDDDFYEKINFITKEEYVSAMTIFDALYELLVKNVENNTTTSDKSGEKLEEMPNLESKGEDDVSNTNKLHMEEFSDEEQDISEDEEIESDDDSLVLCEKLKKKSSTHCKQILSNATKLVISKPQLHKTKVA
jgi:hypothetical protein